MSFSPGSNAEELFSDSQGNLYDSRGNPVGSGEGGGRFSFDKGRQVFSITSQGQPIRYADVFPGPTNVHQNQALSDFAVAHELDSGLFVATELAPIKPVSKRSDIYYILGKDEVIRDDTPDERAVGGVANEVSNDFDTGTYEVATHAFRDFLPDETADNADEILDLSNEITRFITNKLMHKREKRVLDVLNDTATFTNTTQSASGSGQYGSATFANNYIQTGLNVAKDAIEEATNGLGATHMLLNSEAARVAAASEEIRELIRAQMGREVAQDGGFAGDLQGLPARLFGLNVVVTKMVRNTAKKGQTASIAKMLTDNTIVLRVDAPSRRTSNAVTTFRLAPSGNNIQVRTYRDEPREGTWIEGKLVEIVKITNANGAYILTDTLA